MATQMAFDLSRPALSIAETITYQMDHVVPDYTTFLSSYDMCSQGTFGQYDSSPTHFACISTAFMNDNYDEYRDSMSRNVGTNDIYDGYRNCRSHNEEYVGQYSDTQSKNLLHRTEQISSVGASIMLPKPAKYTCGVCFTKLRSASEFSKHVRSHRDSKVFTCEFCGKEFKDRRVMIVHRRIHTKEKPYYCGTCTRYFSDRSTFAKHQRIHTGDKPYTCTTCNKSFSQSGNLIRHRRNVHK
jgi:uncharacterized Zn-finger protein